jgi:hypothetical protein
LAVVILYQGQSLHLENSGGSDFAVAHISAVVDKGVGTLLL